MLIGLIVSRNPLLPTDHEQGGSSSDPRLIATRDRVGSNRRVGIICINKLLPCDATYDDG